MASVDYDELRRNTHWNLSLDELGLEDGGPINIGVLASDRQVDLGRGAKNALIHENSRGEVRTFTFQDLKELSNGWVAALRKEGIQPLDRVALFLERSPELYVGFVGILKAGAVVQPLFSAFGEEALEQRLEDSQAVAVITQKKHLGKVRRVQKLVPSIQTLLVIDHGEGDKPLREDEGERAYVMENERVPEIEAAATYAESPSVLHYTSGTTGKPKGALHVHSSVLAQYLTTKMVLDLEEDDLYWCTADPGWVTGTSYGIIGPWSMGATQLVVDAGFSAERWYKAMQDHKVTVWYTAPTAIRLLMKEGVDLVKKFDLSALRHMCSVGEPLNPEGVIWGREAFGLDFHDTFWQTETGSMMITNLPGMPVKAGSMGKPFPAVNAAIVNGETGVPVEGVGEVGMIAIRPPWPSLMRTYWNNSATYYSKFLNGWYICGDRGSVDEDGYYWFSGRDDDVINTGGHLVGPFEIESALLEHEAVAESAAIGVPDPVNMEVVKAYVALKPGFEGSGEIKLSIMNFIRKRLSPLAMPQEIEFIPKLPKTRSGKIMRRLLRAMHMGEDLGDTSTLEED